MIPNKEQITVVDTTDGEKIQMELDAHSLAHIMSVLTDLYSDTEMACIREYSTNAFDAQVEAGVTRPIEVFTPTALRPLLVIRDFGIGMNVEDIRKTYSKYGASSKRHKRPLRRFGPWEQVCPYLHNAIHCKGREGRQKDRRKREPQRGRRRYHDRPRRVRDQRT